MKAFSEVYTFTGKYWVPFLNEEGIEIFYSIVEYQDGYPVDFDPEIKKFWNYEECMSLYYEHDFIEA